MFSHRAAASASIYTLSLHDALPICTLEDPVIRRIAERHGNSPAQMMLRWHLDQGRQVIPTSAQDRKSTRLNSSHVAISYAVFCLKKKILSDMKIMATNKNKHMHVLV